MNNIIIDKFIIKNYEFIVKKQYISYFKTKPQNIECFNIEVIGPSSDVISAILFDIGVKNISRFARNILLGINVGASDYSSITYNKEANKITFLFGMENNYDTVDLEFYLVVLIFQKSLQSIKKYVEEYACEEKEEEWYKDFLVQLNKLNSVEVTDNLTPEDMKKMFQK